MMTRKTIRKVALWLLAIALVIFLLGWALAVGCGLMGLCT